MQIQRVSLITPPYHSGVVESAGTWLNLGFVYIAGALRKAGFEVDYYDAMSLWHGWDEIHERIAAFKPDVVATTTFTASIDDGLLVLALAKKIDERIVTVIGNVHATFCYEDLLNTPGTPIDYVVRGEGEQTLPDLLHCLNAEKETARIPGLAYNTNKGITITPEAPFIENLDELSTAWDLVEWQHYTYRPKPDSVLAIVSSSRGCRQNCSFCSQQLFWKRSWRARSPENFVAELEMLNREYGVTVAMLADEIPTLDRVRWERILDLLIQRQPGVALLMETRVDDILRDADIMGKYRQAGIEHIYVGVEAGSQATLDIFRKGTLVEQSKQAIDLINGADIVSETSFVLGMPDDTPESIARTIELAKHYDPDMAFFLAIAPWPYADLYPELAAYVETTDYRKYNLVEPVLQPKNMSRAEVGQALESAARDFFMYKFKNISRLSPWKQEFMLAVLDLLINHSYLGDKMQAIGDEKQSMPPEVMEIIKSFKKTKKSHPYPSTTLPPIP